ncbi:hypothetical protein JCGZ_12345 [Jatropha curcas]|uniref:DM2 domain-containing protein n=1 Tax=Jatropha curcas TaxID=180498 RepID=A0A067KJ70_JATCU|nr:upstream activation factor subunit spp27 [Jatropha curcas]KDP31884.1 hypothetical protein JCGZ_12345 [Jatropha curcas]
MVSDSELIGRLREFLRNSDLDTTTTGIVRRQLEEDFSIDLSDKKAFIREQVDLFLQSQFEEQSENEEEGGEGGGEDDQAANVKSEETEASDSREEGDGNDEEEEEEATASNGKNKANRRSNTHNNEGKKRGGGFSKLCNLSPQLQEFIGVPQLARTEVVKQLWAYIREKDLQDPNNRRNINCDKPLRALFGVDSINMFQMNKALSKHIWPLDSQDVEPAPKEKQRKQEREEGLDEPKRKEKRQKGEKSKGEKSGFLAPLQLSDALIKFLGTGENALSRAEVVKRMWEYIKQNNLQDPSDKRRIICDEKLKQLFDVDFFNGFTVSKLLSAHFVKA